MVFHDDLFWCLPIPTTPSQNSDSLFWANPIAGVCWWLATQRGPAIPIINARVATRKERKTYAEEI